MLGLGVTIYCGNSLQQYVEPYVLRMITVRVYLVLHYASTESTLLALSPEKRELPILKMARLQSHIQSTLFSRPVSALIGYEIGA